MSTKKLQILTPIVTSVNGETGDVTIDMNKTAVGLDKVDNTSDADKPISNATQTALDTKQDKITANGLLRGDGDGNISAVSGNFLAYEPIVDVEATPSIDADTLNGKTYENIKSYVDKRALGKNLLDNWYFGNPVNQRGQARYEAANTFYGVDRWKILGIDAYMTVTPGSLKGIGYIAQPVDNSNLFEGMQLTLSALLSDNTFGSKTFRMSKGMENPVAINSNGYLVYAEWNNANDFFAANWYTPSEAVGLVAIKLELGTEQTLAHQDANGAWVLNEIPDYGEQLLKCQRYLRPAGTQFITSQASGNMYGSVVMINSYPMRAVPSIVNANYVGSEVREVTGGVAGTITNVFTPSIYGSFTVQLSGTSMPNHVYIDPTGFNPLLSAEL